MKTLKTLINTQRKEFSNLAYTILLLQEQILQNDNDNNMTLYVPIGYVSFSR